MMTLWSWYIWCEVVDECLYRFMCSLPREDAVAMNEGFDEAERAALED